MLVRHAFVRFLLTISNFFVKLKLAFPVIANAQAMSLSDFDCGSRIPCTRLTGSMSLTGVPDGNGYKGPRYMTFGPDGDSNASDQCPINYQCVDSIAGMVGMETSVGCCERCGSHQSCTAGSIGLYNQSDKVNLCPPGHLCDPEPHKVSQNLPPLLSWCDLFSLNAYIIYSI